MDKYLLEILKEVNTIIIPGLGALTITNKDTGEIMFMDYLKHDDGKLAEHIAEKDGIDINDAKNMIAKYVREISSTLDKGESYDMFEFGSFVKEGDSIGFKSWDGKKTSDKPAPKKETKTTTAKKSPAKKTTAKEAAPTDKKAKEEKKSSTKKTTAKATSKAKKETSKPDNKEKLKEPEVEKVVKEVEKEKVEPPIVPIDSGEKKEMNIAEKEELEANVKKLDTLKDQQNKSEKKKRGVGFYVLIIVAILVIGGGTTTFIFYDDVKGYIPFLAENNSNDESSEEESENEQIGAEDEIVSEDESIDNEFIDEENEMTEEEVIEEVEEEIETEPEVEVIEEEPQHEIVSEPSQSGFLPFHVILGSFSEESNAQRFVAKLQAEGYPNAKIMYGSGLHMVSAKAFSTREEAEQSKTSIGNGWVLEWR